MREARAAVKSSVLCLLCPWLRRVQAASRQSHQVWLVPFALGLHCPCATPRYYVSLWEKEQYEFQKSV